MQLADLMPVAGTAAGAVAGWFATRAESKQTRRDLDNHNVRLNAYSGRLQHVETVAGSVGELREAMADIRGRLGRIEELLMQGRPGR